MIETVEARFGSTDERTITHEFLSENSSAVPVQRPNAFKHANEVDPHSALGYKSPRMFRKERVLRLYKLTLTKHQTVGRSSRARSVDTCHRFHYPQLSKFKVPLARVLIGSSAAV